MWLHYLLLQKANKCQFLLSSVFIQWFIFTLIKKIPSIDRKRECTIKGRISYPPRQRFQKKEHENENINKAAKLSGLSAFYKWKLP